MIGAALVSAFESHTWTFDLVHSPRPRRRSSFLLAGPKLVEVSGRWRRPPPGQEEEEEEEEAVNCGSVVVLLLAGGRALLVQRGNL